MTDADLFEWAAAYVTAAPLADKLAPPPAGLPIPDARPAPRDLRPGRPPELTVAARASKAKTGGALVHVKRRAELFHRFFHHELQAAELMAWAIVRFPEAPAPFLRGLRKIAADEIRHASAYLTYVQDAGFSARDFPVRDWFWERVPAVTTPAGFCAVMGLGLEGGNLDHMERLRGPLEAAGDARALALLATVHEEEIPHVRFGRAWFVRFTAEAREHGAEDDEGEGPLFEDFAGWRAHLPPPLTPALMKGSPLDRVGRARAGLGPRFCEALEAFTLADR